MTEHSKHWRTIPRHLVCRWLPNIRAMHSYNLQGGFVAQPVAAERQGAAVEQAMGGSRARFQVSRDGLHGKIVEHSNHWLEFDLAPGQARAA